MTTRAGGAGDVGTDADPGVRETECRATDGPETRPGKGLAGNAGHVIRPRERTDGLEFDGRFGLLRLDDRSGGPLEAITTGPVAAARWINPLRWD